MSDDTNRDEAAGPTTDTDEAAEPGLFELLVEEFAAGGITVTLVPGTPSFPTQLVVPIDDESDDESDGGRDTGDTGDTGEQLRINTYFVPGVVDPPALQYFVTLPYAIAEGAGSSVTRFIAALNASLPMTGFEYSERNQVVVFRHTHAISIQPLDPGVVAWTWSMIRSTVVEFGDMLRGVCAGDDVDAALEAVDTKFAAFTAD